MLASLVPLSASVSLTLEMWLLMRLLMILWFSPVMLRILLVVSLVLSIRHIAIVIPARRVVVVIIIDIVVALHLVRTVQRA